MPVSRWLSSVAPMPALGLDQDAMAATTYSRTAPSVRPTRHSCVLGTSTLICNLLAGEPLWRYQATFKLYRLADGRRAPRCGDCCLGVSGPPPILHRAGAAVSAITARELFRWILAYGSASGGPSRSPSTRRSSFRPWLIVCYVNVLDARAGTTKRLLHPPGAPPSRCVCCRAHSRRRVFRSKCSGAAI